jgi:hypothetical protein|eukprot:g3081.t1
MVWHDRNSGGSRKGARDAHDLGKERRQKFYKGAKIISQYRKAVKDAEKDGSSSQRPKQKEEKEFINQEPQRYQRSRTGERADRTTHEDDEGAKGRKRKRRPGQGENSQKFRPSTHRMTGKRRPNPFKKQLQAREMREVERQQRLDEGVERQKEVKKALKRRKFDTKKMRKRTKHGQPVMKNAMEKLLEQIQRG